MTSKSYINIRSYKYENDITDVLNKKKNQITQMRMIEIKILKICF